MKLHLNFFLVIIITNVPINMTSLSTDKYPYNFMLVDHFLAVAEGLESLCLRFLPEHRELNRHPDLKFTVKYPSTNTNEK